MAENPSDLGGTTAGGRASPVEPLTPRDRIDACLRIAEFENKRFETRVSYQWKIILAFWTGILVSLGFAIRTGVKLEPWSKGVIVVSFLIVAACFCWFWQKGLWRGNHINKGLAQHFRDEAAEIMKDASYKFKSPDMDSLTRDRGLDFLCEQSAWSERFQLAVTVFLVIVACITIWRWQPS